jgi:hypothetical protein
MASGQGLSLSMWDVLHLVRDIEQSATTSLPLLRHDAMPPGAPIAEAARVSGRLCKYSLKRGTIAGLADCVYPLLVPAPPAG